MSKLDENELIDKFCESKNCHVCDGTGEDEEPNGYGCPALEDYLNQNNSIESREK